MKGFSERHFLIVTLLVLATGGVGSPTTPMAQDLTTGTTAAVASGAPRTPSKGPEQQSVSLDAVVSLIAEVPEPGSVPYKDCVVGLHLTSVRAVAVGRALDPEIVVFTWGMRNDSLLPITRFKAGQRVRLEAVPWAAVEPQFGSFNRVELDDHRFLELPHYWSNPESISKSGDRLRVDTTSQTPPVAPPAHSRQRSSNAVAAAFAQELADKAASLSAARQNVFRGEDGWLFYAPELRSLGAGRFWGSDAVRVSRAL